MTLGLAGFGGGSIYLLNRAWYKNKPRSEFHFFNDAGEWLLMDKIGHSVTSYQIGRISYEYLHFTGYGNTSSIYIGGSLGFVYLSFVEWMDGYAKDYGFSYSDMMANAGGALLFISQQKIFTNQILKLKYSFLSSGYEKLRPEVLGENLPEQMLKDYNGQVYWISFDMNYLYCDQWLPGWLDFAVGYGADGMLYGFNEKNPASYRQFYLSPDIDFAAIPVKSKFLKKVFLLLNFYHFPLPALEMDQGRIRGLWLR